MQHTLTQKLAKSHSVIACCMLREKTNLPLRAGNTDLTSEPNRALASSDRLQLDTSCKQVNPIGSSTRTDIKYAGVVYINYIAKLINAFNIFLILGLLPILCIYHFSLKKHSLLEPKEINMPILSLQHKLPYGQTVCAFSFVVQVLDFAHELIS